MLRMGSRLLSFCPWGRRSSCCLCHNSRRTKSSPQSLQEEGSMSHRLRLLCRSLIFVAILSSAAFADGSRDRTQVGHSISIGPGEEVTDATCFGCSIRVRGHISGDVTAFGGSVMVEDQGQVNGDATVFGGDIRLE